MTTDVQRELAEALPRGWGFGEDDRDELAAALLPVVIAYGNARAAEELRAVAASALEDRVRTRVLNLLRDRADELDPPAAAPPPTPIRGCACVDCGNVEGDR